MSTLFVFQSALAQTTDDIKKEADALFKKNMFVEATPLYLQLLNVEPRNHELNFKYGACLIYSAQDKSEAIRFLNFSVKNPSVDPLAHFYLGKAYHLNFQFSKALTAYRKFEQESSQSEQREYEIKANINACQNGKQLLSNITDMIVIDKTEVKQQDFYELYKLNDIGGSLLITDQFQTKIDKKKGHRPIIYFPQDSPYIFYSSYGQTGETGLDIYVKQRMPNGKWSNAIKVVGDVNTEMDEDYPYLSPDGKYLYYSSKGHNSMGGYDVFRSKVIVEGSSFSKPENMDFAVSSPNDDILYIVDSLDRMAYFSSARESQDGKLFVYKVRVEKIPMQLAVLKGDFVNELEPNNRNIEVEISNFATGAKIGKFNSSPGNGSILLTIPKSGKYIFDMTVKGASVTHRAEVAIPYMKEFRPLKIDLTHKLNNGQEVIVLKTLFDEKFDDPTEVMAGVFQKISKLNPNASRYNLDSLNNLRNSDDVFAEAGLDNYVTSQDVVDVLSKGNDLISKQKDDLTTKSFITHNIADQKQKQAESKMEEAKNIIAEANISEDPAVKNKKLTKAYKLVKEAEELNKEAKNLVNLGQIIETELKKKKEQEDKVNASLLSAKALDQNDGEGLTNFVKSNTEILSLITKNNEQDLIEKINKEGNSKRKELNDLSEKVNGLKDRQAVLENKIANSKTALAKTKKKKEIAIIESEMTSAQSELDVINSELIKNEDKLERFENNENDKIALVNAVGEIEADKNQVEENKGAVSNTQKMKIKYGVNSEEFVSDIADAQAVFSENGVSGESINLVGLNESTVVPNDYPDLASVEKEIENVLAKLKSTSSLNEKEKLQNDLKKLNELKELRLTESQTAKTEKIKKEDLVSGFNKRQSDIMGIKDVEKRKAEQNKLNNELIDEIDKAIKSASKEENNETEIEQLAEIRKEVEGEIKAYDDWKAAKDNQNNVADFTYQDALESVNMNYQSRVEAIFNSEDTDEQKTDQLKTLNTATLANAKEKLQESEAILSGDPDNALATKEKRQYSRLINELETNISLPLIEPNLEPDITQNNGELSDPDQLMPNYSESINKIENSAINELDKEKAKLNVNKELLVKINSKIQALSPNTEEIKKNKKSINDLEELKDEIKNEIASGEAIIEEELKENPQLENSVESIVTNYTSQSYQINELGTEAEKVEAIKALNKEAIEKIEKEITKTKIANAANPREELQYEIEELESLQKQISFNIDKDYYGVVDLESNEKLSEIKGNTSVYEVNPDYKLKMESIIEDAISQKDIERKKIELNEATLAMVEYEIRRIENGISSTPDNKKQLNKRAESLSEIKTILNENIYESKAILGEDVIAINLVVDIEDVNPDYLTKVNEIKSISDPQDKESAIKKLNRETIELIEEKMSSIESDIRKNGVDRKKLMLRQKYGQLVAEIQANPQLPVKGSIASDNIALNNTNQENVEFPVIYKNVDIREAIPSYGNELDSILALVKSPEEKEADKIALYNKSIEALSVQIKELETYSMIDSPNKEYAEEKIKNLSEIINVLESEKMNSQKIIDDLSAPKIYASLEDIMPDYDTRKEKIEYESTNTIEKLEKTNELNKVLLFEIDSKIEQLESLQKEGESETRKENIDKLNELSEAINQEILNTGKILKASEEEADLITINENKFEPLNPNNFKNDLETNQLNLIKKDVKLIKSFEKDIARLNRKKARLTGNAADKVQKEIDKTIVKQSTLHNRLILDLEGTIDEKLWTELTEAKEHAIQIKGANMRSDEIRNAEEGIQISEAKIERAKAYRDEASQIKNQVVANKILLKAAQLEYEAQQLLVKSNASLKTAAMVTQLTNSDPVIVEVSSTKEKRTSESLLKLANEIERRADAAEARSLLLADSVLTVKKKYREAIVLEMEEVKEEEARLRLKAESLRNKAEEIREQESELLTALPTAVAKDVPKTDQLLVLKSNTYSDYFGEMSLGNQKLSEANQINQEIDELKEKAGKIIREAIVLNSDATAEEFESDPELSPILSQIANLLEKQKNYREEALSHFKSASQILDSGTESDDVKENMIIMAERHIEPDTQITLTQEDVENTAVAGVIETAQNTNTDETPVNTVLNQEETNVADNNVISEASTDYIPPSKLNGQLFRITDKAVYSNSNPIPVNAKQPEGLVYKVQVGAFRKPLPPQTFDKFAPISGQVINSGVTRYMVGYFTNFEPADAAKREIRGIKNYGDAFVVAYYNGERISIARAKELETNGIIPGEIAQQNNNTSTNQPNSTQTNNNTGTENQIEDVVSVTTNTTDSNPSNKEVENKDEELENLIVSPVSETEKEKSRYYTSVPNAAPASQVEIIEGLFYTVQIGVYSKPVPASELFNVSPLNSQLTKSGKVRYSTGIYTSIEKASERKNELVEIGIVDAFVTAYYNGNRISILESKELINEKGEKVLTSGKTKSEIEGNNHSRYNKENIYYRILLGKYKNVVPSNVANYLFNDDNIFFETEIDADNTIYLYTQKFFEISEIQKRLVEINELGFEDMEILSYYNIQTIPFNEAQKIINNEPLDELTELETPQGVDIDNVFYEPDAIYYRVNIEPSDSMSIDEIITKLANIPEINFEQETTENNEVIIHTENLTLFSEAEIALKKIEENGIKSSEIVAFHKYVQISVEKAREIKEK